MSIQPTGIQMMSGGCDSCSCDFLEGETRATVEEARESYLRVALESFLCTITKGVRTTYFYGEDDLTHDPIPEPPDGFHTVVLEGFDHDGGMGKEFYAIPRGSTIGGADRIREVAGCPWIDWGRGGWDNLLFPDGFMESTESGWKAPEKIA